MNANTQMTFYGQEKVEYNAQLCLMNMAVHGLNGKIVSGDEANSFYHDAHNLAGKCDYVMANPPFNVDKVKPFVQRAVHHREVIACVDEEHSVLVLQTLGPGTCR